MNAMTVASRQLIKEFDLVGVKSPDFFRSIDDIERFAGRHRYSHLMRRAWEQMHLNGILCVNDIPTVYFKEVKHLDSRTQRDRYQKFWNQGLATLLVVKSPTEVQVYSSLAEPAKEDSAIKDQHRLVEILDSTSKILNFVRRVQTGQIYRDNPKSFKSDKTVDKFLLKNLKKARDLLHDHKKLKYKIAHALLGRIIFTCYLVERGIIDSKQFNKAGAEEVNNLHELFTKYDGDKARDILYDLFDVLQGHFNGSMFDATLEDERPKIFPGHISILRRLLNVEDIDQGQQTFHFWAYDFRVIPVETISSIYEEFLAAEDEEEQRKSGAFYTPKHLAEMVVNVAIGNQNLLGKKILDPSCGSGIFLVILFNRIAEQWRRKHPGVYNNTRSEALLQIISDQLCGVDINETACRIACFSLYLAFLDQLSPRDIHQLEKKRGKVLNNFLALKKDNYGSTKTPVIFEGNFFEDVPIGKDFDLIIGNPPWVSRRKDSVSTALDWCLSESNPYLEDAPISKANRKRYFLPANQIAHAFMWKTPMHLKASGRTCLVLPTKVLFNNKTDKFQAGWFSNVSVDKVIQLSDWRHILFENADCPAVIIKFSSQKPVENYSVEYEVPKVSCLDPRRGVIDILPEDRKTLQLSKIQELAYKNKISIAWKENFWGTKRDALLIDRLLEMPCLGKLVGNSKEEPKLFFASQGFQPFKIERYLKDKKSYGEPQSAWWKSKQLYVNARKITSNLIITEDDCEKVGDRFRELHRIRDKRIYTRHKVLVNKGFTKAVYCDFPVIFQDAIYSISGFPENYKLLMFITAVLNSNLARYFQFHTSANSGIEREQIYPSEYKRLPFPLPKDTDSPKQSRRIIDQVAEQMSELKASVHENYMLQGKKNEIAKQNIEYLVYEYYGISERERMLIEDTVNIFKKSMMPTAASSSVKTLGVPSPEERRYYVELVCEIINSWAKRSKFRVNGRIEYSSVLGESIVTLTKSLKAEPVIQSQTSDELQSALNDMRQALPDDVGRFKYHRNLKVFDDNNLYILKPLTRRHWTKTAAINDADEVVKAILSSGRES